MAKREMQPDGQTQWIAGFEPPPPWGGGDPLDIQLAEEGAEGAAAHQALEANLANDNAQQDANDLEAAAQVGILTPAAALEEGGLGSESEPESEEF